MICSKCKREKTQITVTDRATPRVKNICVPCNREQWRGYQLVRKQKRLCTGCNNKAVRNRTTCKTCAASRYVATQKWMANNPEKCRAYGKKYRTNLKKSAFEKLGGVFCSCCGESQLEFLTIDHIKGVHHTHKGTKKRGGTGLYAYIMSAKNLSNFQVLCMNCNWAKDKFGKCPHLDKDGVYNSGLTSP